METLTANLSSKAYRTVLNGREYLVAPLTMMVPGVIAGSAGPLFYPPELVAQSPESWNGMPIVVYHPTINGQFVSARRPDVMDSHGIGTVYNARVDKGKLIADGWFDVETTNRVDKRVLNSLEAGLPIELSTGLDNYLEPVQNSADYNGTPYTHVVKDYLPDHLAILPDQTGACSLKDGCGVFNSTIKPTSTDTPPPSREPVMAFDRVATIGYLTANCDCWKGEGDKALLEGMPDAALVKLEATAKKAVVPPVAVVTTNVIPSPATVPVANAVPATTVVPVAQPVKALNMQDWLAAAPTEAQQVWNNAVRVNNQHRSSLIGKLTTNVADGDRKQALIQLLSTKSVDELQVLADSLSPPAPAAADPLAGLPLFAPSPVPTANYMGASGLPSTVVNNGVKDEDDDILPLPVYNWGQEQAKEVS